jgi:hypothetical protein
MKKVWSWVNTLVLAGALSVFGMPGSFAAPPPGGGPGGPGGGPGGRPGPGHPGGGGGGRGDALPAALGGFLGGVIIGNALSNSSKAEEAPAPQTTTTTTVVVPAAAPSPYQRIISVQSALQQLGYYNGSLDGVVGPGTSRAISTYQRDYQLPITGRVDQALLVSLGL